jgi:hypothetical protein
MISAGLGTAASAVPRSESSTALPWYELSGGGAVFNRGSSGADGQVKISWLFTYGDSARAQFAGTLGARKLGVSPA